MKGDFSWDETAFDANFHNDGGNDIT